MSPSEDPVNNGVHLIYQDPQFSARSRAASALRRLGNAFVRHRVNEDELASMEEWARLTAEALERSQPVPDRLTISNDAIRTLARQTDLK